jgi:hypothetical protein
VRPAQTEPYDRPLYAMVKFHRDHHVEVGKALYSVPGDLIGRRVQVRADSSLVRVFSWRPSAGREINCPLTASAS